MDASHSRKWHSDPNRQNEGKFAKTNTRITNEITDKMRAAVGLISGQFSVDFSELKNDETFYHMEKLIETLNLNCELYSVNTDTASLDCIQLNFNVEFDCLIESIENVKRFNTLIAT